MCEFKAFVVMMYYACHDDTRLNYGHFTVGSVLWVLIGLWLKYESQWLAPASWPPKPNPVLPYSDLWHILATLGLFRCSLFPPVFSDIATNKYHEYFPQSLISVRRKPPIRVTNKAGRFAVRPPGHLCLQESIIRFDLRY